MNLGRWIDTRQPAPHTLSLRMAPAIAAGDEDLGAVDECALGAALSLANAILCDGSASRTGAMTLLAADALLTYAFEAAAETPGRIDGLAREAILRIAASVEHAP